MEFASTATYTDNRAAAAAAVAFSPSLKHSRSSSSEMDSDAREDRLAPNKIARSDTFPLSSSSYGASLIRSNSLLKDTSSNRSDSTPSLFSNDSASLLTDSAKAELLARAAALQSYHLQESALANLTPFKVGGQATLMNLFGGEPVLTAQQQQQQQTFSANQLRELQLQALIFKHLMNGVAVPPELVIPIRAAIASRSLALGGHPLGMNIGWGNYHLGYGASTDPEPGRCRRTDGKKWRCSRDVVPDQKYCERHMHRGRHRARKLADNNANVNGLNNNSNNNISNTNNSSSSSNINSVASVTATNTATTASIRSFPETSSASSIAASASCNRNALTLHLQQQQQSHSLPFQAKSSLYSTSNVESSPFNLQQQLALQISAAGAKDFRYMDGTEHSFLSDSQSLSGITAASAHNTHSLFTGSAFDVGTREPEGQPLRHFFDDNWPRGARDPAASPWTQLDDERSNHRGSMQLSISTDFGSDRASSPSQGPKLELSPLKLSMSRAEEDDPLGLGLGQLKEGSAGASRHHQQQQANWLPIAWDQTSGGPLAEMLQSSSNCTTPAAGSVGGGAGRQDEKAAETRNGAAGLNLIDAWESSSRGDSPSIAASPTGVLQVNATFGSFSDTSTASSPRSAAPAPPAVKGGAEPSPSRPT